MNFVLAFFVKASSTGIYIILKQYATKKTKKLKLKESLNYILSLKLIR